MPIREVQLRPICYRERDAEAWGEHLFDGSLNRIFDDGQSQLCRRFYLA